MKLRGPGFAPHPGQPIFLNVSYGNVHICITLSKNCIVFRINVHLHCPEVVFKGRVVKLKKKNCYFVTKRVRF
jgi:hypothetical protein